MTNIGGFTLAMYYTSNVLLALSLIILNSVRK